MNILLIGECYSENLGDAVICETVAKLIKEKYSKAEITFLDISGRLYYQKYFQPDLSALKLKVFFKLSSKIPYVFRLHPLYRQYEKNDIRYLRTCMLLNNLLNEKQYDIALFAGGEMFLDYFAGLIYYIVKKLNTWDIPVVFHACGMGRLSKDSVWLLKKAVKQANVKSISLRDSFKEFCALFGKLSGVQDTYDTALCCSNFYEPASVKTAEYGVGVIAIPEYYETQKTMISLFLKSSFSWKLFTNGSPGDESIARKLLGDLGVKETEQENFIVKRPLNAAELVKNITEFERIVSYRMHSQIIASAFIIPSYGFVWDSKVKAFYNKLGFASRYQDPGAVIDDLVIFTKEVDCRRLRNNVAYEAEKSKENLFDQIETVLR